MLDISFYVFTATLSVAIFLLGHWVARKTRRLKTCSLVAIGFLFLKTVLHHNPAWEATLFPWVSYVYFQSYWLYPIGLFFFGLAAPQLPIRWNRVVVTGLAGCFFVLSLWNERWMLFPPDDSSTNRADSEHHCRQATGHTCAPAACVSLLSYWGIDTTEGEMVRLCRTRKEGTKFFNIYRGLVLKTRDYDREVRIFKLEADELATVGKPLIIGREGHAVAVRIEEDRAVVHDPLSEKPVYMTLGELVSSRYFTGVGVTVME